MAIYEQLFGLPSLTLAAAVESLLVIKLFPAYCVSLQSILLSVVTIFLANYAFGALFWLLIYPRLLSPLRHIPGPRELVSMSHRNLLVTDRPPGDLYLDLVKQYPGQDIIHLSASDKQILIAKPRLLADLLVHHAYDYIKPPMISGFLRHVLGDGLIIIEGSKHKFLRKNTMPAFSFRHIKDLYPMMWKTSTRFMGQLKKEIADTADGKDAGVVELSNWASRVTMDIIGVAGLGRQFNMLEQSEEPLLKLYEALLEPSAEKLLFAMLSMVLGLSVVRMFPWRMNEVFNYLSSSLSQTCLPMIHEKREAIVKKGDDHFDVLSLLIKSDNFTDNELKDQLLTFLAAGHETTASAITWAAYLLSTRPEIQKKLREEVREALPMGLASDESVDLASTLEQLPYLNGIMHETLRLYATVPTTTRQAIQDTQLGEQLIPKGTVIVLSIWLMNRSPEVWGPEAGEFQPERWITDGKPNQNGGASSNYAFLTFLHGPRSCIGQGFAKAELRCLLAAMVGAVSWELSMDEKKVIPRGVITIKPAHGMHLKFKTLQQ